MRKPFIGRAVLISTAVAIVASIVYLLAPLMGTDLSAQVARADFFAAHGGLPVDFRWYGGTSQFGYSLISPAVMTVTGARGLGVLSAVASSALLAYIFVRTGSRRPVMAGVLGAICMVGDIVSGRTTFAFGIAFGIGALAVLVTPGLPVWLRRTLVGLLSLLATLASPVAGLFVGVAAGAMLLGDFRLGDVESGDRRPRFGVTWPDALTLGFAAVIGLVPSLLFGDSGMQPFTDDAVRTNVGLALAIVVLVPATYRMVRFGAVLAIVMLFFALYVHSAIGSNSERLTMLFAIPVIVAYAVIPRWWLVGVVVAMVWWQNPIMMNDIQHAGAPEARASFYQPLLTELATKGALGRIEVVPLRDHWESRYVANQVPLARGWERQVDTVRNPLFYNEGELTIASYGTWLSDNAVQYVAIAPYQPLDTYAAGESTIVADHPSYLHLIWQNADWTLYGVAGTSPFVWPGTLVASQPDRVVFDAGAAGDFLVRVVWSRWLTVSGPGTACVVPDPADWTIVRVSGAGRYTLSSGITGVRRC